jgi:hypothetical protein
MTSDTRDMTTPPGEGEGNPVYPTATKSAGWRSG